MSSRKLRCPPCPGLNSQKTDQWLLEGMGAWEGLGLSSKEESEEQTIYLGFNKKTLKDLGLWNVKVPKGSLDTQAYLNLYFHPNKWNSYHQCNPNLPGIPETASYSLNGGQFKKIGLAGHPILKYKGYK